MTVAMVQEWKADPSTVPAEWQDFWQTHGPQDASQTFSDGRPVPEFEPEREEVWGDPDVDALDAGHESTILDSLSLAVMARERADRSVVAHVGMARASGYTWSQIGDALGVTKQAAAQRFGP